MPAILYGSEAWCLKESEMGILQRTEGSMVRAMCGVQLKDRKRPTDLMLIMGLKETIDQLAMTNNVRWDSHVLWREDYCTAYNSTKSMIYSVMSHYYPCPQYFFSIDRFIQKITTRNILVYMSRFKTIHRLAVFIYKSIEWN